VTEAKKYRRWVVEAQIQTMGGRRRKISSRPLSSQEEADELAVALRRCAKGVRVRTRRFSGAELSRAAALAEHGQETSRLGEEAE
jgi:hypothetical protein